MSTKNNYNNSTPLDDCIAQYKTPNYVPNTEKRERNLEQSLQRAEEFTAIQSKLNLVGVNFQKALKIPRTTYYGSLKRCSERILKKARRLLHKVEKSGKPHPMAVSEEYSQELRKLIREANVSLVYISNATKIKVQLLRFTSSKDGSKTLYINYSTLEKVRNLIKTI